MASRSHENVGAHPELPSCANITGVAQKFLNEGGLRMPECCPRSPRGVGVLPDRSPREFIGMSEGTQGCQNVALGSPRIPNRYHLWPAFFADLVVKSICLDLSATDQSVK